MTNKYIPGIGRFNYLLGQLEGMLEHQHIREHLGLNRAKMWARELREFNDEQYVQYEYKGKLPLSEGLR